MNGVPQFPGGTSVSHLQVYGWPADDAPHGSGTPHLHTVAAEAYVVTAGTGAVQTISSAGFAEHCLEPGRVVWFEPGTVHRLVNGGGLELVVVMSDAGIPEAGDAVLTMTDAVLADDEAYHRAVLLPAAAADEVERAARARRDAALEGFTVLRERVQQRGAAALEPLHAAASRLVASRVAGWGEHAAAARAADRTAAALAALACAGDGVAAGHLAGTRVAERDAAAGERRFGMCGRLRTWPLLARPSPLRAHGA